MADRQLLSRPDAQPTRPQNRSRRVIRFIVLSTARTGSNLLALLLDSVPGVSCLGEIAKEDASALEGFKAPARRAGRPESEIELLQRRDPKEFLHVVLSLPGYQACGFKLFYYHRLNDDTFWAALPADLRIVHLTRDDELAALVSLRYAEQTGEWSSSNADRLNDSNDIRIPIEEAESYFREIATTRRRALHRLRGRPRMTLRYEQLASTPLAAANRTLKFLDQPPVEWVPEPIRRQSARPIAEKVSNFQELAQHFAGTPWGRYFVRSAKAPPSPR